MRRQDIQLLALARQGDSAARCEVGRRYLLGVEGFPKHISSGLHHLNSVETGCVQQASRVVAECLSLEAITQMRQQPALEKAAAAGSPLAQLKLGVWTWLRRDGLEEGLRWITTAASAGHPAAKLAAEAVERAEAGHELVRLLHVLTEAGELDGMRLALVAAFDANANGDLPHLIASLRTLLLLQPQVDSELAVLIAAAAKQAEHARYASLDLPLEPVKSALAMRAHRGDRDAAYMLGRALCGIPCGDLPPEALVSGPNLRKGVALLLRAADAGCYEAWMHLYSMHSDHRLSVANLPMARFCLEKAATAGQIAAQRKLGALILRAAETLEETESAITWLNCAATHGDSHAQALLRSLVLPLEGKTSDAEAAIECVRKDDPWTAHRMALARHFGLTKLEALFVDPVDGLRPWGLVVGRNPFISQIRLASARAIPALNHCAIDAARRAAAFHSQAQGDAPLFEGDLRRRTRRQRRTFERYGIDETMFFAQASANVLEALRLGPKWAFRERESLRSALAA